MRSVGRYIGFDISVPTFLAAVENPLSVLYTENLTGKSSERGTVLRHRVLGIHELLAAMRHLGGQPSARS